jgi:hypothetical protein
MRRFRRRTLSRLTCGGGSPRCVHDLKFLKGQVEYQAIHCVAETPKPGHREITALGLAFHIGGMADQLQQVFIVEYSHVQLILGLT